MTTFDISAGRKHVLRLTTIAAVAVLTALVTTTIAPGHLQPPSANATVALPCVPQTTADPTADPTVPADPATPDATAPTEPGGPTDPSDQSDQSATGAEPAARTAAATSGAPCGPTPIARSGKRPNIVVVMLDDMRSDEMQFAPNARRFVRERGLDFRNSFSPYPLCCPARASFLLGKYAHNHHVLYHEAPYGFGSLDDHLTIGTRLQQAGYHTALVGKYLNGYGRMKSRVTGKASNRYVPAGWTDWMVGIEKKWPQGSPLAGNTYNYFDFTQNINGHDVGNQGRYSSDVIGAQVRGLITKYHKSTKPFFMWVTPVAPHHGGPAEPDDPGFVKMANGKKYEYVTPARPNWVKGKFDKKITHGLGQPAHGPAEANISDKPHLFGKFPETTPAERRALTETERQRAESIYAWDVQFGKIVAQLKKTGEYKNTVIVFTSDNGYYNGEHRQRLGKIKAHEPVLHVPLVVAGPGIRHGVRYTPITTFDLTATVLDMARARDLPAMDGASKYDAMLGPDQPWTVPMVTEGLIKGVRKSAGSGIPQGLTTSGIRTGRYKLIRYATGEGELYDLQRDPLELTSLFGNPKYAGVQTQLDTLWRNYRTCRAAGCQVQMPAELQTSPTWLARQFSVAQAKKRSYYGR